MGNQGETAKSSLGSRSYFPSRDTQKNIFEILCRYLQNHSTSASSALTAGVQTWMKKLNWTVLWRHTRPSRTNTKKRSPFHHRGLECKSRKSRETWSNRQVWPWSTKWSRAKVNRVLPRELTGHSKHPLPATQETMLYMDITRWSILKSGWLYSLQPKMEKLYTVSKNKTWSWLWLRSWTPYCQIHT